MRNFGEESKCDRTDSLASKTSGARRAVKMNLVNEGLEAKRKEEETIAKKRKAEDDANWEGMPR